MSQTLSTPDVDERPLPRGVEIVGPRALKFQRRIMLAMTVIPLLGLLTAIVLLWGNGISGVDFGLLVGFYVFTGLGITVGYHRLFTHKSFDAHPAVRAVLAVAGSMALQGAVIDWVATHRRHHAFADEYGDPHSPHVGFDEGWRGVLRGLFHAHMGWLFQPEGTAADVWAPDLLKDPAIVRLSRAFPWLALTSFLAPAVLGGLLTMSVTGAMTGFVWGGLVRIFLLHHVTWSINSICHFYGTRPFDSHDEARNNMPMALLGFGEGWHNAHHAFPASARHGLRWWELDLSWITIRTLRGLRLVTNVKVPSARQMSRKIAQSRRVAQPRT